MRVQLESGEHYLVPAAVVLPQPAGSVYVPWRVAELVAAPREEPVETMYAVGPVRAEALEVQQRPLRRQSPHDQGGPRTRDPGR